MDTTIDVLVIEPGNGSLWLGDCNWVKNNKGKLYVEGKIWESWVEGFVWLNYPGNLVLRVRHHDKRI